MRKRRDTLSLDEDIVAYLKATEDRSMSEVANDALREAVEKKRTNERSRTGWTSLMSATAHPHRRTTPGPRPSTFRETLTRDGQICCAAVTLAEVCRGIVRTRRVEAALARNRGGQRIHVVPTDERLAKLVGTILHETGSGSERLGDAHVVAVCADADVAVVVTSDPDDIATLAVAVPGTRIVVRDPATV